MWNLIFTVVGLTAFMHIMKFGQARGQRMFALAAVNYAFAALLSAWLWYHYDGLHFPALAALLGVIVGAGYVLTFLLLSLGIAGSGVSLTTVVGRLSIIIPILASLFWDAAPNAWQIAGIVLILVSLPLIGLQPSHNPQATKKPSFWVLALLFITGGAWGVAMKIVSESAAAGSIHTFNMVLFAAAAAVSLGVMIILKQPPRAQECATGVPLGLANVVANLPMLLALQVGSGTVVFATRTSAAVVLTVLLSMIIWRERLSWKTMLGIAIAVVALVLVNIQSPGK